MLASPSSLVWLFFLLHSLHAGSCMPIDSVLAPFASLIRERLLYTEGLFLEMVADGSIRASSVPTSNCVLELRSVRAGETVIKGVDSSLFLCVNPAGHLRGQRRHAENDCTFRELLVDSYSVFLSPHTSLPISLHSKRARKRRGPSLSHFLPVMNSQVARGEEREEPGVYSVDMDSDDPFGFDLASRTHSIISPSMHRKKKRRGLH